MAVKDTMYWSRKYIICRSLKTNKKENLKTVPKYLVNVQILNHCKVFISFT